MILEASLEKNFSVVSYDGWLAFTVQRHDGLCVQILYLICWEENTLAEKVCQNIVSAYKLDTPAKSVQDVGLHRNKLIVSEW